MQLKVDAVSLCFCIDRHIFQSENEETYYGRKGENRRDEGWEESLYRICGGARLALLKAVFYNRNQKWIGYL